VKKSEKENEVEPEEQVVRVPPPPSEVTFSKGRPDPNRPWKNAQGGGLKYVSSEKEKERKREERKQRKKENERAAQGDGSGGQGSR